MFIEIDERNHPVLREADNFRAFKVVVQGGRNRLEAVRTALAGLAEMPDAEHAWVSAAALRRYPDVASDPAWQSQFDAMVEKARPHGWVRADGAVRAHVEWTA